MSFDLKRASLASIWAKPQGINSEDFDSESISSFSAHFIIRPLVQAAAKEREKTGLQNLVKYSIGIAFLGFGCSLVESVARLALAIISAPILLAGFIPAFKESTWTVYPVILAATVEATLRGAVEAVSQSFEIYKLEGREEMGCLKYEDTSLVELWQDPRAFLRSFC